MFPSSRYADCCAKLFLVTADTRKICRSFSSFSILDHIHDTQTEAEAGLSGGWDLFAEEGKKKKVHSPPKPSGDEKKENNPVQGQRI